MRNPQQGFTLIEIMIVVVILGVIAAIAMPSYDEYSRRGKRAEGMAFLQDVAARQERYATQNNTYVTSSDDYSKLGLSKNTSETDKYTLTISATDSFTLTATPTFSDPKCGNLTLNARGVKTASAGSVNDCWR